MGDTPADFLEFAHARSDQLFRTACLLTGDRHLAEDLVQETLAKMYRSWRRIDRSQAPVAYAHTVLVRTFTSYRRLHDALRHTSDAFAAHRRPVAAHRTQPALGPLNRRSRSGFPAERRPGRPAAAAGLS
ncbi:sigma factor [Kitasatospora sp. NBC_01560]|uniref:sigma factor n=1 Tax=Kitasatospora sp. NBC_01560 TaxID=2975965 RepID=UPI00386B33D9